MRSVKSVKIISLLSVFGLGLAAGVYTANYWANLQAHEQYEHLSRGGDVQTPDNYLLMGELALLEARLARVDALGQRLVMIHDLSTAEFNFDEQPGIGGLGDGESSLVKRLHEDVVQRETKLRLLRDVLNQSKRRQQALPSGWPVRKGWVTSDYGRRINPFTYQPEIHQGIDIAGSMGAEVHAAASGIVTWVANVPRYGLIVEIDHGNGYRTRYAHNQVNLVKEGDVVRQDEVIALLGNSGRSTGPHLHFEVIRNGRHVPPRKYLSRR